MSKKVLEIRDQIQRLKTLPTMPGVVKKLCTLVESDETPVSEIADIISTDQVLAAKVLKIVNSPFYGFPGRIGTINHAGHKRLFFDRSFDVLQTVMIDHGG